ncbi:hypothetical protein EAF00_002477 [Botryotinia globosa]|nr:hypothetical protein EAF00_002477 [Botryotinia globosa]
MKLLAGLQIGNPYHGRDRNPLPVQFLLNSPTSREDYADSGSISPHIKSTESRESISILQ